MVSYNKFSLLLWIL